VTWFFDYWPVYLIAIQGLSVWISWSMRRGFLTREDYEAGVQRRDTQFREIHDHLARVVTDEDLARHQGGEEVRYTGLERRLAKTERTLAATPTRDDLVRVHTRLDEQTGLIKSVDGSVQALIRQTQMINQFLLEREK
jgi:hypothetical protein